MLTAYCKAHDVRFTNTRSLGSVDDQQKPRLKRVSEHHLRVVGALNNCRVQRPLDCTCISFVVFMQLR